MDNYPTSDITIASEDSIVVEDSKLDDYAPLYKFTTLQFYKKHFYLLTKRLLDILASLFGILLVLPAAIIVKISFLISKDTAPIFFIQKRVGKDGKIFKIYKFRSMIVDADDKLKQLLASSAKARAEWEKHHKLKNDPRITPIGKIIRKTSIDELPQFFNVLKGDMSLVGPRPFLVGEIEPTKIDPTIYYSVRPGLTGWWAVNGRASTTFKKRLELEKYYIENRSITLDLKCLLYTIKAVFTKNGAK